MMKAHLDPRTVNSRKVLAGLKFIGAPFELVRLDFLAGGHQQPDYVNLNPNAQLPTLTDGDFVLWESNAILQYAADKVGNESVYPSGLEARANINRWLFWEATKWLDACYPYMAENCVKRLMGEQPDQAILDAHTPTFHKQAAILDELLSDREWIAGDTPTIADIAMAAPIHVHEEAQPPLDEHKHLKRWLLEGVETLPCWEETHIGPGFTVTADAA